MTLESKPSSTFTAEAVPSMMTAQDGLYGEAGQDGFWDEYPLDGFYAPVGYLPEFKPPRRATGTLEGVPAAGGSAEAKPPTEYAGVGGAYLADGTYLADGSILAIGSLTSRILEIAPS